MESCSLADGSDMQYRHLLYRYDCSGGKDRWTFQTVQA